MIDPDFIWASRIRAGFLQHRLDIPGCFERRGCYREPRIPVDRNRQEWFAVHVEGCDLDLPNPASAFTIYGLTEGHLD
ncbi:hypothetical protein ACVWWG_004567 [Bradyrhizobium sp. LB7.2]